MAGGLYPWYWDGWRLASRNRPEESTDWYLILILGEGVSLQSVCVRYENETERYGERAARYS